MLNKLGETVEYVKAYAENKVDLVKLSTAEMLSLAIAKMMMMMCIGLLVFVAFVFFMIGGALAIGEAIDSLALGMVIMGAVAIFLTIVLYILRKPLLFNPTVDTVIEMLFKDEDDG